MNLRGGRCSARPFVVSRRAFYGDAPPSSRGTRSSRTDTCTPVAPPNVCPECYESTGERLTDTPCRVSPTCACPLPGPSARSAGVNAGFAHGSDKNYPCSSVKIRELQAVRESAAPGQACGAGEQSPRLPKAPWRSLPFGDAQGRHPCEAHDDATCRCEERSDDAISTCATEGDCFAPAEFVRTSPVIAPTPLCSGVLREGAERRRNLHLCHRRGLLRPCGARNDPVCHCAHSAALRGALRPTPCESG